MRQFTDINEQLDFLDFRQQLLYDNDDVSRLLFEYEITRKEYNRLMDLMDKYRNKIATNMSVSSAQFEQDVYKIVPKLKGDYHFCEFLVRAFYEDHRWEEVFPTLYASNPKYSYLKGI